MRKSFFSIIVLGILATQVFAAPVEKIVTRILYSGEIDSVRKLYHEVHLKLRNHLYGFSDEEFWIADQSYDKFYAYNIAGKFLREFELPKNNTDSRHRWICGFEGGKVCYLALIDTPFVQTQGKFAMLKWDCESGKLNRNDLDYSGPDLKDYKRCYYWYDIIPLFAPKFAAGYFFDHTRSGTPIVFDKRGQYLGRLPFQEWSAAGFGLVRGLESRPFSLRQYDWRFIFLEHGQYEKDISKYLIRGGKFPKCKYVTFNPYSAISDPQDQAPEYVGMDKRGFVYLFNVIYYSDYNEIRLVRFDPLHNRADQSTQRLIVPGGSHLFQVMDRIVTPKGLILLSILQPDRGTVLEMLKKKELEEGLLKSAPSLNYYVYKIQIPAKEWVNCPLRTLEYER